MTTHMYEDLAVTISSTAEENGNVAAAAFAEATKAALATRDEISVILATGNSQLDFIDAAVAREDIEWSRITVLHMDEYYGMSADHPASFRRWMRENIQAKV
ncbi:6-phosphogluconolactonase, partial [Pseudactinotalea sp. Z1732]